MAGEDTSKTSGENMLFKIAGKIAESFFTIGPKRITQLFGEMDKQFPKPGVETWDALIDQWVKDGRCFADTGELLKGLYKDYRFPVNVVYFMMTVLKVTMSDIGAATDIYNLDQQYINLSKSTPNPAPVDSLVKSMIVDPKRSAENRAQLKKHGFNDTQIDNIILSYYRLLPEDIIKVNFLRKNIDEDLMYERMRELGYTDVRTAEMVQTWEVIPGPQDLFMMVAKEAFEPETYKMLGLDVEFPTDQSEHLEAQGISEYWQKKYWIAHWDQPSVGQGFEMFQRGHLTFDQLQILFKTLEIPQFWRDRLTKIAYNPLTRVDVRRMHDMGVVGPERLAKAYTDLGLSPDDALDMANFTVEFNLKNDKDLTKGSILTMFKDDLISRSDATDLLLEMGYKQDPIDLYLIQAEFDRAKAIQDINFDNLKDRFLLGINSETTTRGALNTMGIKGEKVNALISTWNLDKYKYQSLPSRTDLEAFVANGIITEGTWRNIMSRHGFSALHMDWYWNELQISLNKPPLQPSKSEINAWLKNNIITEDQWIALITAKGYDNTTVTRYLQVIQGAKAKKAAELLEKVADASEEPTRQPTRSDYTNWMKEGLITETEFIRGLELIGYSSDDITLYVERVKKEIAEAIARAVPEPEPEEIGAIRVPTRTDYSKWYVQGIISEEQWRIFMKALGYSQTDISNYFTSIVYGTSS